MMKYWGNYNGIRIVYLASHLPYVNHPATDPATVARRPLLFMQPITQMTPHATHRMNGNANEPRNYIANGLAKGP